ncbi:MAG: hypothetical protein H7235_09810 [Bdellovibrionaceae bacterium]|nr:hypothetical protein [Pseudobdellovibrionaceae bacterium]
MKFNFSLLLIFVASIGAADTSVDTSSTLASPPYSKFNYIDLTRSLAALCKTDKIKGSTDANEISCVASELKQLGYTNSKVTMIRKKSNLDITGLPVQSRSPKVSDIRHYLGEGYTVIMTVGWYNFNTQTHTWERNGGHAFSVVGYSFNQSWQENQIVLSVINPNLSFRTDGKALLGDTITMISTNAKPDADHPEVSQYTLIGNGFLSTNFVEEIISYLPE